MPVARGPADSAQLFQPDAYPHWLDTATHTPACRGADLSVFFTDRKGAALTQARALCHRCPLLDPCKAWALAQSPRWLHGVWGGTTQYERQEYHRRLRAAQRQEAA